MRAFRGNYVAVIVQVVNTNDKGYTSSVGLPTFFMRNGAQFCAFTEDALRPFIERIVGKHDEIHITFSEVD